MGRGNCGGWHLFWGVSRCRRDTRRGGGGGGGGGMRGGASGAGSWT